MEKRELVKRITADVSNLHTKSLLDNELQNNPGASPQGTVCDNLSGVPSSPKPRQETILCANDSPAKPALLPSIWKLRCRIAMTLSPQEVLYSINQLCEECAQSQAVIGDYKNLENALRDLSDDLQIDVLINLGGAVHTGHDTPVEHIKMQPALFLLFLHRIKGPPTTTKNAEIKSMLKSWARSSNENVRRIGFAEIEQSALSNLENSSIQIPVRGGGFICSLITLWIGDTRIYVQFHSIYPSVGQHRPLIGTRDLGANSPQI
jgi:hypothetical protein